MKESDPIDMITKFLSGSMSGKEKDAFLLWVDHSDENKALYEELSQVWDLSDNYQIPEFETNIGENWNKVESRLDVEVAPELKVLEPEAKVRKLGFPKQLLQIAAVFLIVSLAAWWFMKGDFNENLDSMVLVKTALEEVKEIELPDGTKVWLNGGSELAYDEVFEKRKVELRGEAFFDVTKKEESLFEIYSGAAKTVVLGTAFNVRAYPREAEVEVTVVRGKVALQEEAHPEKTVILEAGNAGAYKKAAKKVVKETKVKKNADSWKTNQLNFENVPLVEVLESLERHFNVKIETANRDLLKCHFTGDYRNPELEQIFQVLEFGIDLKVKKEKDRYLLEGKGCK